MKNLYDTQFGKFYVDTEADRKLAKMLAAGGYQDKDELALLLSFMGQASVACDIGAHIGTTTVPLARHAAQVHAFEPMSGSVQTLRENIALNNLQNVVVHAMGLADKSGTLPAEVKNTQSAATFMLGSGGDTEVPVDTLDTILKDEASCALIKIDVEGMEPLVLQGAQNTLRKHRPVVYFELNLRALRQHGHRVADLSRIFKGHHYGLYLAREGKLHPLLSLSWTTMTLVPREWFFGRKSSVFNVFALPKEHEVGAGSSPMGFACRLFFEMLGRAIQRKYLS
jgi:FkbM family methyltransferase